MSIFVYIHAYCMYVKRASLYDVVYKNNLGRIHLVLVGPEHNILYDTNTIFTCLGRRIDTVEKWVILTWNIKIKKCVLYLIVFPVICNRVIPLLKAITKANVEYSLHMHTLYTRCEIVVF